MELRGLAHVQIQSSHAIKAADNVADASWDSTSLWDSTVFFTMSRSR